MNQTRVLYFLLAFCATVSQGLWVRPLRTEAILIVDIPLFLLFVLGRSTRPRHPGSTTLLIAMIFFILWPVVGALNAVNRHVAFVNMITNVRAFLIALAIFRYVNSKKDMEYLIMGLGAGLLFQGTIALYQFKFGYAGFGFLGEGAATWRTTGTLGHPNVLAMYSMMLIPLVYRFATFIETKYRTYFFVVFVIGIGALFTSQGRACWLAFAISMLLFFLYDLKGKRVFSKETRRIWLLLALVAAVGAVRYTPVIISRFSDTEQSLVGGGTSSRLFLALDAIRIIGENPVYGVGLENYRLHASELTMGDKFVHCSYLLVAAETGIIGGIIFLWLLFEALRQGFKVMRSEDKFIANVAIGVMTAVVAFDIAILPSPDYRIPWVKNHIWLLFGLTLALGKMDYWARRRRERLRALAEVKRRSTNVKGVEERGSGDVIKNNGANVQFQRRVTSSGDKEFPEMG